MGLREGDLQDTVLQKISLDEFEPKTGESKDIIVCGFSVNDKAVGKDLNAYIHNSRYFKSVRDIEVSPNRDEDGYFMVFVEFARNTHSLGFLRSMVKDIERVTGELDWEVSTHLTDDFYPLESDELAQYLITDPDKYMTRKEFESMNAERETVSQNESIVRFLEHSMLEGVKINNNSITMRGAGNSATLEIVGFGLANEVMKNIGIHESAIENPDTEMRMFNNMLGEMNAVRIGGHIVIYGRNDNTVLVTK